MSKKPSFYIVISFVLLSIIGLTARLVTDPFQFFKGLVTTLIIFAIIFFIVKKFVLNKSGHNEQRAYNRAARQSARRFKNNKPTKSKQRSNQPFRKRRSASHLTVIDGKKNNRKNRA